MSEKPIPFVVNDRRKFTSEGDVREGVDLTPAPVPEATAPSEDVSAKVVEMPAPAVEPDAQTHTGPGPIGSSSYGSSDDPSNEPSDEPGAADDDSLPPAPTEEQMEQSKRAFEATADRIDMAVRASNPGADHPPSLTFESLVQSVYMQAVMQLGGGGAPAGEQPQIDLLGARQSIDMLTILLEKTRSNLTKQEDVLLSSAVFELRLAFLDLTQALARSAQQRSPTGGPGAPPAGASGGRPGPSIVR